MIERLLCHAQGNEFSYYMLLTSDFMLNACERAEQWVIFPYIHSNCNHIRDAYQLRQVCSQLLAMPWCTHSSRKSAAIFTRMKFASLDPCCQLSLQY